MPTVAAPPIRLLLDRILVLPDKAPKRIGMIHLPDEAQDGLKIRQRIGTVVAVGPGRRDKKGNLRPCDLEPGDRVEIASYADSELGPEGRACTPIQVDGEEYLIMNESDVAGRYEQIGEVGERIVPSPRRMNLTGGSYRGNARPQR